MKIFKRIVLLFAGLVILLLVAAFFVTNEYKVVRHIAINKPKEAVFDYGKMARNQDRYNKWILNDPLVKKTYRGTDGTVGFVYAWESVGNAGKGQQEIKSIHDGERIDFAIHFIEPFEGDADTFMKTESVNAGQTKLTWSMEGRNQYPLNLLNLFIPGMLGDDMMTSLATLKKDLEKQ